VDEDGFLTLSEFLELIQQTLGQGFIMFHQSSGWFHGVMNPIDKGCAMLMCPDARSGFVPKSALQASDRSINQSFDHSTNQDPNESTNQTNNQPITQPINQTNNQ
jgi:hypothetical protein